MNGVIYIVSAKPIFTYPLMKYFSTCSRSSSRSGFTLVELLIVIAIIAILAAVTMGAGNIVMKAAMKSRANNTATQIQTACLNYYTEYSVYPLPTDAVASQDYYIADTAAGKADWSGLIYALCGNINPYNGTTTAASGAPTKTRVIAFLTLKSSDVDAKNSDNAPINPLPPSATEPYFFIAIDGDYDNIIGDTGTAINKLPNFVTSTTTKINTYATGGPSGGVAVWANCNGNTTSVTPSQWVHTY